MTRVAFYAFSSLLMLPARSAFKSGLLSGSRGDILILFYFSFEYNRLGLYVFL